MKFNKKLVVTSLSTVLGLGIVGSITGTIAWYQYSTRGSASLVGVSAGESGVLQLSADGGNTWKKDVYSSDFFTTDSEGDRNAAKPGADMTLVENTTDIYKITLDKAYEKISFNSGDSAVTTADMAFESGKDYFDGTSWGIYDANGNSQADDTPAPNVYYFKKTNSNWPKVCAYAHSVPANYRSDNKLRPCTFGGVGMDAELPASAYGNPVQGVKEMTSWKPATKAYDYFQYTVKIKAVEKSQASGVLVKKDVWASDIVLEDADQNNQIITDALRMHLHITGANNYKKDILISNNGATTTVWGQLDLDGDGSPDKEGGYEWEINPQAEPIEYGHYVNDAIDKTKPQTSHKISEIEATDYNESTGAFTNGTKLGTTTNSDSEYLTITVTVWIEGWSKLVPTQTEEQNPEASAIWDSATLGRTIHAGITFDVGDKAFNGQI